MSAVPGDPIYRVAAGVDPVPLPGGQLLFRSDTLAIRIEGGFARVLQEQVLPLLDGRPFSQVAAVLPDLPADALRERLETLVHSRVLVRGESPPVTAAADRVASRLAMLESFGIAGHEAMTTLRACRVAIAGLEGAGAHLAMLLANCGVGELVLLDPYDCEPGNLTLMPSAIGGEATGRSRQDAVRAVLLRSYPETTVITGGNEPLSRDWIAKAVAGCHLLVGCFDRGFSSCHHWLNRAGREQGIPSLYADSRGHTALVGPLVVPGQTGCYLCYRMRSIACEDDFDAAMGYEEFLDRQKRPMMHARSVPPTLPPYIGSLLALECLKSMLTGQSGLAGMVLEFDGRTLSSTLHPVLQKPDCPVCGGGNGGGRRPHPVTSEVRGSVTATDGVAGGRLAAALPRLHSPLTGIVRSVEPVQQDATEPAKPYVFGAEIANHRFLSKEPREQRTCSGKGFSRAAARVSTFGEAVERYSAANWDAGEIAYARRRDLAGHSIDPRALVLYADDQYASLPYRPYSDDSVLGWTQGRSLASGDWVYVPAQAVFLGYVPKSQDEFLSAVTSNGLAGGDSPLDAALAAAEEVLERDAFMIAWLNRLPGTRVDAGTHPDERVRALTEAYRRRGVDVRLYRLPTDHPVHVFAAIAVQCRNVAADTPAAVVGLGADFDPAAAARQAVLEIGQVRPALRHRLRSAETQARLGKLVDDPHEVATLEDHDLLYASPRSLPALGFWLDRDVEPFCWQPQLTAAGTADRIDVLGDWLRAGGNDFIYVNVTPADMAALGLHTARAILPDFQPIHFGWREPRLGGTRLYELPYRLGFTAAPSSRGSLNDDPHPLA